MSILAVSEERLSQIMGSNFFGSQAWRRFYGVDCTQSVSRSVPEFPWSEDLLRGRCPFYPQQKVCETHFAFLGIQRIGRDGQLSIEKFGELHPPNGDTQPKFYMTASQLGFVSEDPIVKRPLEWRWYLMLSEGVPGSAGKAFREQLTLIPDSYEVPYAVEETAKNLLLVRQTHNGQWWRRFAIRYPNRYQYAYCRDVDRFGLRISVGLFGPDGLCFGNTDQEAGCSFFGLAASRRLPAAR